jgi:hypothetical protein
MTVVIHEIIVPELRDSAPAPEAHRIVGRITPQFGEIDADHSGDNGGGYDYEI